MVEVKVGEDDDVDIAGAYAGCLQYGGQSRLLLQRHGRGATAKPGIDEDRATLARDQPRAEVERQVPVGVEEFSVVGSQASAGTSG